MRSLLIFTSAFSGQAKDENKKQFPFALLMLLSVDFSTLMD